jgi:hypothetical protein
MDRSKVHRTLHSDLTKYADSSGTNVDENFNYVLGPTDHSARGYAPFLLAHGQEMKRMTNREIAVYEQKHNMARLAGRFQFSPS